MMISDKLYSAAFQYKKSKLWKDIWDTEVFAVKMDDGETGYVSVMGAAGEYCALAVYIGDKGFQSYRKMMEFSPDQQGSYFKQHELALSQCCYQLALVNKQELSEEELKDARRYTKAHGIRLAGRNAYPQFIKYEPNRYPWRLQSQKDEEYLYQAVTAAITLTDLMVDTAPFELGITEINSDTESVPLMELMDGRYRFTGTVKLPKEEQPVYARPSKFNDIGVRKIKKFRNKGTWECEIIQLPNPIQNNPEEAPYFPFLLMTVESDTYYILPPAPIKDYEEQPELMVNHFIDMLLEQKIKPEALWVRDNRTYALLEDFARKAGIPIAVKEELPALDDAEYHMLDHMDKNPDDKYDEFMDIIDAILQMKESELQNMPEELVQQLEMMVNMGVLPDDIADALADKFDF